MTRQVLMVVVGGLLLVAADGSRAVELICFDENGGNGNPRGLYNFDTDTGNITLRTTVGGNERFFSLAQRPSDGTVFAVQVNASNLFTIDVDTGAFQFVAATGLDTVADISFDPRTDKLYGLGRNSSLLYEIDPGNGASRQIGNAAPVRSGISFAPDGTLYGLDVFSGDLYTIDINTAQPTRVGGSGPDPNTIEDATMTADGRMFFTDWPGQIYEIDLDTGARTLLGDTRMGTGLSGLVTLSGGQCGDNAKLSAKCKRGTFIAKIKKANPGIVVTFQLSTGESIQASTNNRGKAKAKFKDVPPGRHTVRVCGLEAEAAC
ncbi:MAG: hypothetical protein C4547_11250 [Phycisphaerales bacterium]|nr:MAG: hypothetical protein C4547_11250 [Phycisphaerales bacterium]